MILVYLFQTKTMEIIKFLAIGTKIRALVLNECARNFCAGRDRSAAAWHCDCACYCDHVKKKKERKKKIQAVQVTLAKQISVPNDFKMSVIGRSCSICRRHFV